MFGDEDTYADHLDQIKGYCNRYGPGLIIYWNGHVSTLKSNDMVAISDRYVHRLRAQTHVKDLTLFVKGFLIIGCFPLERRLTARVLSL